MTYVPATRPSSAHACCERHGLTYADGKRCWRHATDADRALVADLDQRAPACGIRPGQRGEGWPYGPNIDVESRRLMLDWAERLDLRLSSRGRCLDWLRHGRCSAEPCHLGTGYGGWLDHVTGWNRGGRPAVLISQPYGLSGAAVGELAEDTAALDVHIHADAWYRHGALAIEVWCTDR